jgi:hypothetical protein
MKKYLTLLVFSLVFKAILGNPIMVFFPVIYNSELYFDDSGQWQLELSVAIPDGLDYATAVDSLFLETNTGIVKVKPFIFPSSHFYIILTQDSLIAPLEINPVQDHIILHYYAQGIDEYGYLGYYEHLLDFLNFGFPGNNVLIIYPGQSICYNQNKGFYYKDNSPTLGYQNNASDASGFVKGYLYDINQNLVTSGAFRMIDDLGNFVFDETTNMFTVKVYAKNYFYNYIWQMIYSGGHRLDIDPVQINVEVDSTVIQDLFLEDAILRILENLKEDERISVMPSPNPCKEETSFLINIPLDINYHKGFVTVYNTAGEVVRSLPFSGRRSFALKWSTNGLSGGSYVYSLTLDDQPVKSGHLLIVN